MNRSALLLSCAVLFALSGCAAPTMRYPSLLPRPVETQPLTIPQIAAADIAVPTDSALEARIATIDSALAQTAGLFAAATERATAASASATGAAIGSEAWLSAQSALAALESLRSESLGALADLDRLAIDRGTAGEPAYPAVTAARARAEAQLTTQQAAIDAIQGKAPRF